jgi:uncharacterized protein (TIGR00255 family)
MPFFLKEYELDIRNMLNMSLIRGKIDVNIINEKATSDTVPSINLSVAGHYLKELKNLTETLNLKINDSDKLFSSILKMPEILSSPIESIDPAEWIKLKDGLELAINNVNEFRLAEGKALFNDLNERIIKIAELQKEVDPFEPERSKRIKERIRNNLNNFLEDIQHDKNRFEQEMIYYIEKLDITEEKVRLKKHCEYFLETMKNEEFPGKKLGFIGQEIGREINTMGAKANDADIQKIVVLMKDELEKIKEQLYNIL